MKPLLAYAVLEQDDNTGGIVFARHRATAQKRFAKRASALLNEIDAKLVLGGTYL